MRDISAAWITSYLTCSKFTALLAEGAGPCEVSPRCVSTSASRFFASGTSSSICWRLRNTSRCSHSPFSALTRSKFRPCAENTGAASLLSRPLATTSGRQCRC